MEEVKMGQCGNCGKVKPLNEPHFSLGPGICDTDWQTFLSRRLPNGMTMEDLERERERERARIENEENEWIEKIDALAKMTREEKLKLKDQDQCYLCGHDPWDD